jgi:hypothetical protein
MSHYFEGMQQPRPASPVREALMGEVVEAGSRASEDRRGQ